MRVICVDDEQRALEVLMKNCGKVEGIDELSGFSRPEEALAFAKEHPVDVAFLDIDMPVMTGVELAKKLKKLNNRVNIVFCTAYSEYALEAIKNDCSGYLLKPASAKDIAHQFEVLRYPVQKGPGEKRVKAQCFGNFEIYCDGKPLGFKYEKTKEMLAVLVDRNGAVVSLNEISARLWEDDSHMSYLRKLRVDALDAFTKAGVDDILVHPRNGMAINKERITCDYYEFLDGKAVGFNSFHGEYMSQYSWAEDTLGLLFDDEL